MTKELMENQAGFNEEEAREAEEMVENAFSWLIEEDLMKIESEFKSFEESCQRILADESKKEIWEKTKEQLKTAKEEYELAVRRIKGKLTEEDMRKIADDMHPKK